MLTKNSTGTWILSGNNTYTGLTTVAAGTLKTTGPSVFPSDAELNIHAGARIELDFTGTNLIHSLTVNGDLMRPGVYGAGNLPDYLMGTGHIETSHGAPAAGTVISIE